MSVRYVLAPEAALDLVQIWRYIKRQSGVEMADRVESVIRDRLSFGEDVERGTSSQGFDGRDGEVFSSLLI